MDFWKVGSGTIYLALPLPSISIPLHSTSLLTLSFYSLPLSLSLYLFLSILSFLPLSVSVSLCLSFSISMSPFLSLPSRSPYLALTSLSLSLFLGLALSRLPPKKKWYLLCFPVILHVLLACNNDATWSIPHIQFACRQTFVTSDVRTLILLHSVPQALAFSSDHVQRETEM